MSRFKMDLVTLPEAAKRWQVSTARAYQLKDIPGFPAPAGKLGNAQVWRWKDIDGWREKRLAAE